MTVVEGWFAGEHSDDGCPRLVGLAADSICEGISVNTTARLTKDEDGALAVVGNKVRKARAGKWKGGMGGGRGRRDGGEEGGVLHVCLALGCLKWRRMSVRVVDVPPTVLGNNTETKRNEA